jgi:hypothetical protein
LARSLGDRGGFQVFVAVRTDGWLPEKNGLGAAAFLSDPETGFEEASVSFNVWGVLVCWGISPGNEPHVDEDHIVYGASGTITMTTVRTENG